MKKKSSLVIATLFLISSSLAISLIVKNLKKDSKNNNKNQNENASNSQSKILDGLKLPENMFILYGEKDGEETSINELSIELKKPDKNQNIKKLAQVKLFSDPKYKDIVSVSKDSSKLAFSPDGKVIKIIDSVQKKLIEVNKKNLSRIEFLPSKKEKLLLISRDERGEKLEVYDILDDLSQEIAYKNPKGYFFSYDGLKIGLVGDCEEKSHGKGLLVSGVQNFGGIFKDPFSYILKKCVDLERAGFLKDEKIVSVLSEDSQAIFQDEKENKIVILKDNGTELTKLESKLFPGQIVEIVPSILENGFYTFEKTDDKIDVSYFENGEKDFLFSLNFFDSFSFTPRIFLQNDRKGEFLTFVSKSLPEDNSNKPSFQKIVVFNRKERIEKNLGTEIKKIFNLSDKKVNLDFEKFVLESPKSGSVAIFPLPISGKVIPSYVGEKINFQVVKDKDEICNSSIDVGQKDKDLFSFENFKYICEYKGTFSDREKITVTVSDSKGNTLASLELFTKSSSVRVLDDKSIKSIVGTNKTILKKIEMDFNKDGTSEYVLLTDNYSYGGDRNLSIIIIAFSFNNETWEKVFEYTTESKVDISGPTNIPTNFPMKVNFTNGENVLFFQKNYKKTVETGFNKTIEQNYISYHFLTYNGSFVEEILKGENLLNGETEINWDFFTERFLEYRYDFDEREKKWFLRDVIGKPTIKKERIYQWKDGKYVLMEEKEFDLRPKK